MHNYALTWQQAAALAAALFAVGGALRLVSGRAVRAVTPFVLEIATIAVLYAVWQFAGSLAVTRTEGALGRAHWIERVERAMHLPSEASVQAPVLGHPLLVQASNLYYAAMHFTGLFVFLLWLFVRHRDQYRRTRLTIIVLTMTCLLVQLVPVAPPRYLAGYTDTAAVYGQSVYTAFGGADQFSAMPSVHVGWAVLIAVSVVRISPSRWRWIAVAHALVTLLVVVVTANHFWLDGIVAVAILGAAESLQSAARRAWTTRPRAGAVGPDPRPDPVGVAD